MEGEGKDVFYYNSQERKGGFPPSKRNPPSFFSKFLFSSFSLFRHAQVFFSNLKDERKKKYDSRRKRKEGLLPLSTSFPPPPPLPFFGNWPQFILFSARPSVGAHFAGRREVGLGWVGLGYFFEFEREREGGESWESSTEFSGNKNVPFFPFLSSFLLSLPLPPISLRLNFLFLFSPFSNFFLEERERRGKGR